MVDGLVVVRSGQQVFRPVVRDYLTRVTYEGGWTRRIQLPQYPAGHRMPRAARGAPGGSLGPCREDRGPGV